MNVALYVAYDPVRIVMEYISINVCRLMKKREGRKERKRRFSKLFTCSHATYVYTHNRPIGVGVYCSTAIRHANTNNTGLCTLPACLPACVSALRIYKQSVTAHRTRLAIAATVSISFQYLLAAVYLSELLPQN